MFLWEEGGNPRPFVLLVSFGLVGIRISWFQSFLFRCSPLSPVLVCRHLLFGFSSDELRVVQRGLVYALNVLKYFIWLARNDHRFGDIRPSAMDVLENVKVRLRFNLPVLYRRFKPSRRRRYFHRQWGARGVLAAVVDGPVHP